MLHEPQYQYLTQDDINIIILALATSLDSWADECSKTIADGENMKIARILGEDNYYIQLKKIRAGV